MFYPNYRGSTGRGVEFSKMGQADAAGKEFDDLIDGIDHLIELGIADRDAIGVTGGSYGGYASAWCSTFYSDRFAASVMFVGISDNISKVGHDGHSRRDVSGPSSQAAVGRLGLLSRTQPDSSRGEESHAHADSARKGGSPRPSLPIAGAASPSQDAGSGTRSAWCFTKARGTAIAKPLPDSTTTCGCSGGWSISCSRRMKSHPVSSSTIARRWKGEVRSEWREARGERREARGERREASGEWRVARGERREARGGAGLDRLVYFRLIRGSGREADDFWTPFFVGLFAMLSLQISGRLFVVTALAFVVALPGLSADEGSPSRAGGKAQRRAILHTADSLESVLDRVREKRAVLIDVRELREWEEGHLERAVFCH